MDNHILKAITKNGSNQISLQEQQAIQDWREQSKDNDLLFSFLTDIDHYQKDLKHYKSFQVKGSHISTSPKIFPIWILVVGILLLSVGAIAYSFSAMKKKTEINFALLDDQSEIQLFGNSNVKIHENFGKDNRNLTLEGKAFFDVAHNPEIPFVIFANNGKVTVKGTSFVVEEIGDKLKVSVRDGVVGFSNSNYSKILRRGEAAEFSTKDFKIVDSSEILSGLITESYRETTVSDLLQSLVDKYNIDFVIKVEANLENCLFTGNFQNASVFDILEELNIIFQFDFYLEDGVVLIEGAQCEQ